MIHDLVGGIILPEIFEQFLVVNSPRSRVVEESVLRGEKSDLKLKSGKNKSIILNQWNNLVKITVCITKDGSY